MLDQKRSFFIILSISVVAISIQGGTIISANDISHDEDITLSKSLSSNSSTALTNFAPSTSTFDGNNSTANTDDIPILAACGSLPIHPDHEKEFQSYVQNQTLFFAKLGMKAPKPQLKTFTVHFHVITDGKTGDIPENVLTNSIKDLERDFKGVATFKRGKTNRIKNSGWFNSGYSPSQHRAGMKNKLHIGGKSDLNIYTIKMIQGSGISGYANLPAGVAGTKTDGVVIDYTRAGKSTVSHEVGHWSGLYHTFENGCTKPNDQVDDTPAATDNKNIVHTCKPNMDTCPGLPGKDPIYNLMGYACQEKKRHFTEGQKKRMMLQLQKYR